MICAYPRNCENNEFLCTKWAMQYLGLTYEKRDNQFYNVPNNQIVRVKYAHYFVYQLYNKAVLKRPKECRLSRQAWLSQINYLKAEHFL